MMKPSSRRTRWVLLALTVILVIAGAWISPVRLWPVTAEAPSSASAELTVLSFNVNYGMSGDARTLEVLEAADADVILLQETTEDWEASVRDRLGQSHPHQWWRPPGPQFLADGIAIVSRYPLGEVRLSPSASAWFDALCADVQTPRGPVTFVAVHLEPPVSIPAVVRAGSQHASEIAGHFARFDPHAPLIVAGDFNEERGGALAWLKGRGLDDAVVRFVGGEPTWSGAFGPTHWNLQLDHVAHSAELESLSAEVLDGGSDHRAVRVRFRLVPAR